YPHKTEYGIEHLKRPDFFPYLHDLDDSSTSIQIDSLFPFAGGVPLEIFLHILTDLALIYRLENEGGPGIRVLERVSRPWRDFFRSPRLQNQIWMRLVKEAYFMPTAADWTESAERIRSALKGPGAVDWRRFFIEGNDSQHMKNRSRISDAIYHLDHRLGNCDCR
ncbi:hypothetical protein C8J56DRAFT_716232, partial [Mycena floridula]